MSTSITGVWIICAVGVIGLIAAVVIVRLAGRRPHPVRPQRGQMRGRVQGGQHMGGGRSVAPTRDAPVPQGGGEVPTIEEEMTARERHAAPQGGDAGSAGSPMNL